MPRHTNQKRQPTSNSLPRVRWHQWSVVRLAAIARITVIAGYLTAAILAVKSIDQLLHIVHDSAVEQSLKYGLEGMKDAYKTRQDLLIERLMSKVKTPENLSRESLHSTLQSLSASEVMGGVSWNIASDVESGQSKVMWINRKDLVIGPHIVQFADSAQADEYRKTEEVLQRYQVIGLELRERIRPALIKALSVTLAVMCILLMLAFAYMAIRSKTRIQKLVNGFIRYAERDDTFRFDLHWRNELGLLSRQFNRMADELDENRAQAIGLEKLASWQTIARKMAHEIKNPLTPIQIMTSQLKRRYDGSDEDYKVLLEKAHNVILEEVSSLRRMVDDFSQFAQLPSPRFEVCNLVTCVKRTIDLAEGTYAPHTVRYEGPENSFEAEIDEQLIRQALHNLIKNAAEADPGSSTPITLRILENQSHLLMEIEDEGPGIPDELRKSIFEAYVTTKHTGPTPGMGLGLAICQKIVLEHNGKITVDSRPGRTVFRISIPRYRKGVRI